MQWQLVVDAWTLLTPRKKGGGRCKYQWQKEKEYRLYEIFKKKKIKHERHFTVLG
jgi:hypothetical protein